MKGLLKALLINFLIVVCLFFLGVTPALGVEEECQKALGLCRKTSCFSGEISLGNLDCQIFNDGYGNRQATCCKVGNSGCKADYETCKEPKDCCSQKCEYDNNQKANICKPIVGPTYVTPIPPKAEGGIDFNSLGNAIPSLKPMFQPGLPSNVSLIVSELMKYLFVIAGLLLLFYLIAGGFQMMMAANDEKGLVGAKGKITNALVGFLLLFVSYWLVQIIEYILGIKIF